MVVKRGRSRDLVTHALLCMGPARTAQPGRETERGGPTDTNLKQMLKAMGCAPIVIRVDSCVRVGGACVSQNAPDDRRRF